MIFLLTYIQQWGDSLHHETTQDCESLFTWNHERCRNRVLLVSATISRHGLVLRRKHNVLEGYQGESRSYPVQYFSTKARMTATYQVDPFLSFDSSCFPEPVTTSDNNERQQREDTNSRFLKELLGIFHSSTYCPRAKLWTFRFSPPFPVLTWHVHLGLWAFSESLWLHVHDPDSLSSMERRGGERRTLIPRFKAALRQLYFHDSTVIDNRLIRHLHCSTTNTLSTTPPWWLMGRGYILAPIIMDVYYAVPWRKHWEAMVGEVGVVDWHSYLSTLSSLIPEKTTAFQIV